ncbi:hypothetical protein BTZ20_5192 [Rhodococcus sp. MTM3W5.2]|nr:hypothetical protein BTZ20_5192 [Rhodococcus sp. MTM3W5.2]
MGFAVGDGLGVTELASRPREGRGVVFTSLVTGLLYKASAW